MSGNTNQKTSKIKVKPFIKLFINPFFFLEIDEVLKKHPELKNIDGQGVYISPYGMATIDELDTEDYEGLMKYFRLKKIKVNLILLKKFPKFDIFQKLF